MGISISRASVRRPGSRSLALAVTAGRVRVRRRGLQSQIERVRPQIDAEAAERRIG